MSGFGSKTGKPIQPRRQRRMKMDVGALPVAWFGLFILVAGAVTWLIVARPAQDDDTGYTFAIDEQPDRFAPSDWANSVGDPENDLADRPTAAATMPTVSVAATPEAPLSSTATGPEQQPSGVTQEILATGAKRIIIPAETSDTSNATTPTSSPSSATISEVLSDEGSDAVVITLPQETKSTPPKSVISAPPGAIDTALHLPSEYGPYPRIAADGRKAQAYYARKFSAPADQPKIAIIVAGLGLSAPMNDAAIALPPEVSIAFAPYAKNLESLSARARKAGHELLIELPMETSGVASDQLGPAALLLTHTPSANRQRLDWVLTRFSGYFGVTNYLGSTYSSDNTAMTNLLFSLRQSGLAYIDDTALAGGVAKSLSAPFRSTDELITPHTDDLKATFARLETRAKNNGAVLVKIYATPTSLAELSVWIDSLQKKGIILAPASALVNNR